VVCGLFHVWNKYTKPHNIPHIHAWNAAIFTPGTTP
jgi:hypothetical protein